MRGAAHLRRDGDRLPVRPRRGDADRFSRFLLGCAARGVLSSGKFYVSLAHSDSDIAETLDVIEEVLADIEA